jgi:hypothetical protein
VVTGMFDEEVLRDSALFEISEVDQDEDQDSSENKRLYEYYNSKKTNVSRRTILFAGCTTCIALLDDDPLVSPILRAGCPELSRP